MRWRIKRSIGFFYLLGFFVLFSFQSLAYSDSLELIKSGYYKQVIDQILQVWPPKAPETNFSDQVVSVKAWEAPGDPYYIGIQRSMEIQASIEFVDEIINNFGKYRDLFPEFKNISIVSQEGDEILTAWERPIPIPFIPNVKYQSTYKMDRSRKDRKIYRIKLKESNRVLISDDLLVLERKGNELTSFNAFSFFEADWGPAIIFGLGRIWKDSIEGTVLSDLSLKLRAENPYWTSEKIQQVRNELFPGKVLDSVYEHKQAFDMSKLFDASKLAVLESVKKRSLSSKESKVSETVREDR